MSEKCKKCPNCKRSGALSERHILSIVFGEWPLALFASVIVVSWGNFLTLSQDTVSACAILGAIPFVLKFHQRYFCESCSYELPDESSELTR